MAALIAIVGRPNVGKSAIFNRIAGKRIAIVHDEPGVTRDRITAEVEWHGRPFTLVDTGGIGLMRGQKALDLISQAALQQVEIAIESAQVIVLVVNVQEGVVALDREVAAQLRVSGKPVLLAANKADNDRLASQAGEFGELGFDQIFPVSASHGLGIDSLMDAAFALLPLDAEDATPHAPEERLSSRPDVRRLESRRSEPMDPAHALEAVETSSETAPQDAASTEAGAPTEFKKLDRPLRLVVIGRPNVGKSSLINALTQSERVIVSPIPGTTRDTVDVPFEVETEGVRQKYILIDTAGIRKDRRVDNSVEFFSVKRAEEAVSRCDIAILVLDAEAGVTAQDKKVAGKIVEQRKACIVVINKWDLVADEVEVARSEAANKKRRSHQKDAPGDRPATLSEFGRWVQEYLFFLDYAPVVFSSAKTGFHLDRLLETVRYVAAQSKQVVPTAILNRSLHDAIEQRQPVSASGRRLKFFYATQVRQAPPTFLLFVNRKELFTDRYSKYLSDTLRRAFGFEGCPVVFVPKSRSQQAKLPPVRPGDTRTR